MRKSRSRRFLLSLCTIGLGGLGVAPPPARGADTIEIVALERAARTGSP